MVQELMVYTAVVTRDVGSFKVGDKVQVRPSANHLFLEILVNGQWTHSLSKAYLKIVGDNK